jgi:2-polyprenyl-6-hydroxyphenyl methylase/3-demethylubiquinone-9 3-methyltransferase
VATYEDEIWLKVPEQRRLDRASIELARDVGRESAGGRLLDLGCGDGRLLADLAHDGARVVGADRSGLALERARQSHPGMELISLGEDGRLPFKDASFDAVVCLQVLQHVVDLQQLLSEVRRILTPGGSLAIAVPWHGRLKNILIALGSFERHHDPLEPVIRFFTPRSLRDLLEQLSFEVLALEGTGGLPFLRETLLARARRPALELRATDASA